jgi:sigma-B regulation protein RsbU (phosphoserine phosphatase)
VAAGVQAQLIEEFALPGDPRAPAAARRRVTAALVRAQRLDWLETAVLLTSELVTNVVLHAGTTVGIEISLNADGLTIAVSDENLGPLRGPVSRDPQLGEGGRGLALVDALAESWGTTHTRRHKTVWFTLGGSTAERAARPVSDFPRGRVGAVLVNLGADLSGELGFTEQLGELLSRLLDAVGADAGRVWLDRDDGSGPEAVVVRGDTEVLEAPGSRLSAPLSLLGRSIGRVEVVTERPGQLGEQEAAWAEVLGARIALAAALTRTAEADAVRRGWAGFLAEASDLLAGSLDVQRTLALVCQLAVSRLATWAAVHLTDPTGKLALTSLAHADEEALAGLTERLDGYGVSALRLGEPVDSAEAVALGADAGVCVALRARNRQLGRLTLMRPAAEPFRPDEISVIVDLAQRSALAVDNARLFGEQLAVAKALQSGLLPPQLPPPGPLEFGACYHAAREDLAVGGDFYDVLHLSPDEWVLTIGDVCGKGAEAAAVTGVARDVLRLLLRQGQRTDAALCQLNETLLTAEHGRFCTVAVARLCRDGDAWTVRVHSAGHPLPALLGPDGGVRLVGATGTLLGVVPEAELELPESQFLLPRGHALVLYTDGITERRRANRQFGEQGLLAALRDCAALSAQAVAGHVDRAAVAFADESMRDDTAVLVARVPAGGPLRRVGRQRSTAARPATPSA